MVVFLTSSPCDDAPEGVNLPFILKEENEFVANISKFYVPGSNCLMICASPDAYEHNDRMAREFQDGFAYHGMVFENMFMCDARNAEQVDEMIRDSKMIILAGGHVPTQNRFFQEIGLREKLQGFEGAIMGISAGTMNCADVVYAQPEEAGESIDPNYQKFLKGLGFTDINVLPHYQMVKDFTGNVKNQSKEKKEEIQFVRQKIDSARWFIDSIKQRNNTFLETMQTIVGFQKSYFLTGDERNLRPMRLKDVADRAGFDISTISRVSNSKYVETEWGVLPLKFFFSESMSTTDGDEISSKEIKTIIRETINNEDKMSPITDDALTEILNQKGYKIYHV